MKFSESLKKTLSTKPITSGLT